MGRRAVVYGLDIETDTRENGLDPRVANGTSTVALWPGLFGGLFGYRKELENSSTILVRLGATSVIGGALGAGVGTAIGAATGNPKTGAVVGGLVGAGIGGAAGNAAWRRW